MSGRTSDSLRVAAIPNPGSLALSLCLSLVAVEYPPIYFHVRMLNRKAFNANGVTMRSGIRRRSLAVCRCKGGLRALTGRLDGLQDMGNSE